MLTLISLFVCACIVILFRFLNKAHNPPILGVYQQINKYYCLKVAFMFTILSTRKLYNVLKRRIAVELGHSDDGTIHVHEQDCFLEETHSLGDLPMAIDAVYFNGKSKSSATVICGVARRQKGECNAFLYLRVKGSDLLLTPSLPDTNLQQTADEEGSYNVENIKVRNIIPMRTWTLSYDGDMKPRSDPEKTVKVKLSLTWSTSWLPFNYDTNMYPLSMARDVAREIWSRDYFKLLDRYHQTHYEQMGILEGTATIDGVSHKLSMPCVRDHTFGSHRDWRNFHRYVYHFLYLENGDCIAVGSVSQPVILSHLTIGYYCRKSDNTVLPIQYSSFLLYQHGERDILPKDYGFSFKADGKRYEVQVLVNDEEIFYIGKEREAKLYERWATVNINGVKGWGCVEWHYKNLKPK